MPKLPIFEGQNTEPARRAGVLTHSEISETAMGAGIGKAISGLGGALGDFAGSIKYAQEKQDAKKNTEAAINVANLNRDAQIELTNRSINAPADGSGVVDGFNQWFNDRWDGLIAGAETPEQRRYYEERKAANGASFIPRAVEFEATKSAGYAKTQTTEALNGVYSSIMRDPKMFDTFYAQGLEVIDKHYALRPTDKEALRTTFIATAAHTYYATAIGNAETLEQAKAIQTEILTGKGPAALLKPDALQSTLSAARAKETAITSGIAALTKQEAESVIDQLKAGQQVDPGYLNAVTDKVLKYGSPDMQAKFVEQLKVSQHLTGLKGAPKPVLEQTATFGTGTFRRVNVPEIYAPMYKEAADRYGVPAELLAAQGWKESGFDPDVIEGRRKSSAGATGIAQFMPGTAQRFHVVATDPRSSIEGQARYMKYLLDRYDGNVAYALAGYNWGEGNVDKWIKAGADPAKMPAETRNYIKEITDGSAAPGESGRGAYYQQQAGKQALDAYNKGMDADPTKFTIGYVPQFFPNEEDLDLTTGQGLGDRFKGVSSARDYLGEPGIPVLSKDELDQVAANLEELDGKDRIAYATNVQKELGANSGEFWKLLKEKNPEMAVAGFIMANNPASLPVAYDIIRGGEVLKAKWPDVKPDTAIKDYFKELQVTDRLPADVAQVFGAAPGRIAEIQRAADVLYIFRNRFGGQFDQGKYRQALYDVMGGSTVENVNGAPTLLPRGINANQMERALDNLDDGALVELSASGGVPVYGSVDHEGKPVSKPITAEDIATEGRLEAVGPNTYAVRMSFDGGYALDSTKLVPGVEFQDAIYLMKLEPETVETLAGRGGPGRGSEPVGPGAPGGGGEFGLPPPAPAAKLSKEQIDSMVDAERKRGSSEGYLKAYRRSLEEEGG